jgi:hypothetical protein
LRGRKRVFGSRARPVSRGGFVLRGRTADFPAYENQGARDGRFGSDNALMSVMTNGRQIVDPQFGQLTIGTTSDWCGKADWCGSVVRLSIWPDESGSAEPGLQTARELWKDMAAWRDKVAAYAVRRLLDLKNGGRKPAQSPGGSGDPTAPSADGHANGRRRRHVRSSQPTRS